MVNCRQNKPILTKLVDKKNDAVMGKWIFFYTRAANPGQPVRPSRVIRVFHAQCKNKSHNSNCILIDLFLASHKKDIGKQCRPWSDAAERGVWLGSTLFALNVANSIKHVYSKSQPCRHLKLEINLSKRDVEESTRHKWVKKREALE